jgi:hypothetical protein
MKNILKSKMFWPSVFSLLTCLSILLIVQFNTQTKEIYSLKDSKESIETLTKENEVLRIELSQSNAWGNIDSFVEENSFEKGTLVKYVKVTGNTVAINQ